MDCNWSTGRGVPGPSNISVRVCQMTMSVDSVLVMKTADELTGLFREQGLRVTPQRQAIFRLLHGNDTAPDGGRRSTTRPACEMPTISLKTVYQTVHDLEALGEVEPARPRHRQRPGRPERRGATTTTSCARGAASSATSRSTSPTSACPARYRREFRVERVEVIFRGVCEQCAPRADA